MLEKPKFCYKCGAKLKPKIIDQKDRLICTQCETVTYQNPLPIAAAIVFNERQEILLVKRKREPGKDKWCFPMGFAEMGETISQAATRELKEEANIDGTIVKLVNVISTTIEFYDDVLIVTYEVRKTGGVEWAGDDAKDVGYFSCDNLPPMAFESNISALKVCIDSD
jgi:ADP-ribose pyrophosphatase YjhB (NUDIX family)